MLDPFTLTTHKQLTLEMTNITHTHKSIIKRAKSHKYYCEIAPKPKYNVQALSRPQWIVAEESIDRDSLDEGLGDISSDGEVTAESPELKNHDTDNNNQEDEAAVLRAKISAVPDLVTNSLSSECEKERRPSRISFETPL